MVRLTVNNDIVLKEIGLEDIDNIFHTIDTQRDYLGEWLPFVELTKEPSFTASFIENYLNSDRKNLTFVILYQNRFAGLVGLRDTDTGNRKTEIGFWLSQPFQDKGIVTNSCRTVIEHCFNTLNINRIRLRAAVQNTKSQRIAERLRFTREGIERNGELHSRGFVDLVVYSLLKSDYNQ